MAYTCCLWREGGSEWVSEWRQFSNLSAISWRKQVYHQWDDDEVRCVLDQHAELDFIVLAHRNNSLWVDMTLHSDTLFWFRANQPLLFLLHAACLVEKQQKNSFIVFGLILPGLEHTIYHRARTHDLPQGSNPRSTTGLEPRSTAGLDPTIYHRARTHDLPHSRRAR